MTSNQGLSARELLEGVYYKFTEEEGGPEIIFPSSALTEISQGTIVWKNMIGQNKYESAKIISVDGVEWIISLGKKCESCMTDIFNCDIAAFRFSTDGIPKKHLAEEVRNLLTKNNYFRNSIICASIEGYFFTKNNGHVGAKVIELINQAYDNLVHGRKNHSTVAKLEVRYKPESVDIIYNILLGALKQPNLSIS